MCCLVHVPCRPEAGFLSDNATLRNSMLRKPCDVVSDRSFLIMTSCRSPTCKVACLLARQAMEAGRRRLGKAFRAGARKCRVQGLRTPRKQSKHLQHAYVWTPKLLFSCYRSLYIMRRLPISSRSSAAGLAQPF